MKTIFIAAYTLLLRLYPGEFHAEFADEMQGVLVDAITEAAQQGTLAMGLLYAREVGDLLQSVLYEHWQSFRQRRRSLGMDDINTESNQETSVSEKLSSWRETFLGALVFLIYPITLATNVLVSWLVIPLHLSQPINEAIGLTYRLLQLALLLLVWILVTRCLSFATN